jgi:hypothetical protein
MSYGDYVSSSPICFFSKWPMSGQGRHMTRKAHPSGYDWPVSEKDGIFSTTIAILLKSSARKAAY